MSKNSNNPTEISEVQLVPVRPQDGLVAFASCVIDDKLYLNSIGVFTKLNGGFRITFPNKKIGLSGQSISIFNPINKECCLAISEAILKKADELFNKKSL